MPWVFMHQGIKYMNELLRLPSLIDMHVHFRTPGQEYKGNIESESCAALAGGNTTVMDMPNNIPLITTLAHVKEKKRLANQQTHCDIGFYLGTLGDEDQVFSPQLLDEVFGLKIYMNSTTGGYIVNDPLKIESIFKRWESDKPILVHAEGNTIAFALQMAKKYHRHIHVCHVSLAQEVKEIAQSKNKRGEVVSAEVTPHHLFESNIADEDDDHRMRPPLSRLLDMQMLWQGILDGTIDCIATDHAPHTLAEKISETPPHGVTGLETTLPLLLMAESAGYITLQRIVEMTHDAPLRILNVEEQYNTYIEVERNIPWEIQGTHMHTKAKSTPFEGRTVFDRVIKTVLRGIVVFENGRILNQPGKGQVLS
ncbi:hypothetical protein C5B42_02345 [Candidatus Cerribacteria bacterium 'Amazon FNV 2010 28 9']|uniref:Amidohydrolase-related domain-containing protein n=1 Tax=Candidatus Cerribacteria bacterium 'Amazon FNV 2010 28 9' TaxID=2081795 RepID=A0A317JT60_9BACT|nr:MAG: hypothetical protein C5B42_02345 [Candidatus Cerribacteria bacterium 'Amazon FNV 2010 28 9']